MVEEFLSDSESETLNFASKFAKTLVEGDIVIMGNSSGGRSPAHVQIYAGNGTWYNAGSTNAIQNASSLTIGTKNSDPDSSIVVRGHDYGLTTTCNAGDECRNMSVNNFVISVDEIVIPEPAYGLMTFTKTYDPATGAFRIVRSRLTGLNFITYSGMVYMLNNPVLIANKSGSYSITIDCTGVDNYKNMTANDFYYEIDWLDNETLKHEKESFKTIPFDLMMCFPETTPKGVKTTAKMLMYAQSEEEVAAIWIAAVCKTICLNIC